MSFRLPHFAEPYIEKVHDRAEGLIAHSVWEGLSTGKLRAWLANFRTDLDRYFSACLLDYLIYRSERQTIALAKQVFQRSLPDLERSIATGQNVGEDWLLRLHRDCALDPGIRLVPVIHSNDQPTKSAFLVVRLLKRHLEISEDWIIQPDGIADAISDGVQHFVFIDDFLGTGTQFCDFAADTNLATATTAARFTYAPLVAHQNGIAHVQSQNSGLTVVAAEYLNSDSNLFAPNSPCFDDQANSSQLAKDFYFDLLQRLSINVSGDDRLGYGGLGIPFAFQHAVPDNSLLVFWWNRARSFSPLFDR